MAKVGDRYIYHLKNGTSYDVEVINVNNYREPTMKYGVDIYDMDGTYAGDVLFVGDSFLNECEKIN